MGRVVYLGSLFFPIGTTHFFPAIHEMLVFRFFTFDRQQTNRFAQQHFDNCTSRTSPVCLVHLVGLMPPNKPDNQNRPNEQSGWADFCNRLLGVGETYEECCVISRKPNENSLSDEPLPQNFGRIQNSSSLSRLKKFTIQ